MAGLVILDRDGVVNEDSDAFIKSVDEFVLLPNTIDALIALKKAGLTVAIATNQSGIARSLYQRADLHAMHQKLQSQLLPLGVQVDWIVYSPYLHNTACRKPNAGLYQLIAWRFGYANLMNVPVIGDSWRDLEAAIAVGARPILVKTGKGQQTLAKHAAQIEALAIPVVEDLLAAAKLIGVTV